MHKISKWIVLCLVFVLAGCQSTSSNDSLALQAGDYAAILPFQTSDTRVKHVGLSSNQNLRMEVESGLMDLSKQYFSPSEVGFRTHVFLDFDELDATDGSRGLLGTLRDDNPNGLNPSRDEPFDTGNGMATNATILIDIYELDWYANEDLKGISLALVVGDEIENEDGTFKIEKDKLKNYIEVSAGKLVNHMRERFNDISSKVPIYIAAYSLDSSKETYGGFFYEGYFKDSSGSYKEINEDWVLIPSSEFSTLDPVTSTQFATFKDDIKNVVPDYTYVTGKAKYENGKVSKIFLEVSAHAKTAGEILAVSQTANSSLSVFDNTECEYVVTIKNDDQVYAMINRDLDSNKTQVITNF